MMPPANRLVGQLGFVLLALGAASCARPGQRQGEPNTSYAYAYHQPGVGTTFSLTAASQGKGHYSKLQGERVGGPIEPVAIDQSATVSCTETVTSAAASRPTAIEVVCARAEMTEDGATTSWATEFPVTVARTHDGVVVAPTDLPHPLQLKYKRLFGQTLSIPSWAAMLEGAPGGTFAIGTPTPLNLSGAGVFLGDTAAILVSSATATLTQLTEEQATLAFNAHATSPYPMDVVGTLTVDRATGWLVASELRATVAANDPATGFVLSLVVDSKTTRTHTMPRVSP